MNWKTRFGSTTCVAALLLGATPALAQTAAPNAADETPLPIPDTKTGDQNAPAAEEDGEIVVTGLRRSLESAQQIKKNSDQIVDSIVAEDIGKLPDITASAALARVAGVQVNRAAGEAAQVQVRGLPDITTTYNGREIFTAEGRFVQIQDFPAGSVAALEVFKSSTADLIEGGIGGQVNVRSRRPFDFTGFAAFGSLNGIHTDQAQKFDWNGNFLISNRWDTGIGEIGVLVNAAFTKLRHLDSTREQSLVAGIGNANGKDFRFPDASALFYGAGDRWRPSATATIQWKPTPDLEIYADGLFQGYRSKDTNRFLFVPLFGNVALSNVQLMSDGVRAQSLTASYPGAIDFRPDGFTGATRAKTDTYHGALGTVWDPEGGLRVSADVAYTDSTYTQRAVNVDHAFATSPVRDVDFDAATGDGGSQFSFRNFDASSIGNFLYRGLYQENLVAEGDDVQARFDVDYDTDLSFLSRIEAGFRYDDRSAGRRRGDLYRGEPFPFPRALGSLPLDFENVPAGFRNDDVAKFRRYAQPTTESIWNNVAQLRVIAGAPVGFPGFDPLQTFVADEKSYTGYGQVKYGFDMGSVRLDGLIGMRAIRTETTVNGTARVVTSPAGQPEIIAFNPISRTRKYDDYLPNVSARLSIDDRLQFRLAYTQTRTRPNFIDLNPSGSVSPIPTICTADPLVPGSGPGNVNCFRSFNGGNPNLGPLTSNNYDATVEWYFTKAGSLTFAAFRRDLNGFISRVTTETNDPEYGRLLSNIPLNGGDGRVQGIEAAFASFLDFDFVPNWAKGFGLQANVTYIDAKSDLPGNLAAALPPARANQTPRIPGVSKYSYNIVALYEKPQFSARLAYNYRSDFVLEYGRIFDPGVGGDGPTLPLMQKGRGVLDLSMTVTPVPNITIAFDAINLTGKPIEVYREYELGHSFPRQTKYLERLYSLGVRFRL